MAVLFQEPEADSFLHVLSNANEVLMSAVSRLEASVVVLAKDAKLLSKLDNYMALLKVEIVPFDEHQAAVAATASQQFGKGRHPAALNFGDCCTYALAKTTHLPLLFKGDDFSQTDLSPALLTTAI